MSIISLRKSIKACELYNRYYFNKIIKNLSYLVLSILITTSIILDTNNKISSDIKFCYLYCIMVLIIGELITLYRRIFNIKSEFMTDHKFLQIVQYAEHLLSISAIIYVISITIDDNYINHIFVALLIMKLINPILVSLQIIIYVKFIWSIQTITIEEFAIIESLSDKIYAKYNKSNESNFLYPWLYKNDNGYKNHQTFSDQLCHICLTQCMPEQDVQILVCGHTYHHDCYAVWKNVNKSNYCPIEIIDINNRNIDLNDPCEV